MRNKILTYCAIAALGATIAGAAEAAPITGGEIIFTPVLDFKKAGIKIDTFGGAYVDSQGRIHMPVTGGNLNKSDLSNAVVQLAKGAGITLSRTYKVGTSGKSVTGQIRIANWSLRDYGKPLNTFHFGKRESAGLNTTTLKNVPINATKPNPHDVHDPKVTGKDIRKGEVTPLLNLSKEEQELYVNGSLADGSAQKDGRFIVPDAKFHSNQTFGLVLRNDPNSKGYDGFLNDATYADFTDPQNSKLFLEVLEWYHLRINAQSVLGLSDEEARAVGFVDNASLFRIHAEGLTFGSEEVPAPGGLLLILPMALVAARKLRQ